MKRIRAYKPFWEEELGASLEEAIEKRRRLVRTEQIRYRWLLIGLVVLLGLGVWWQWPRSQNVLPSPAPGIAHGIEL